MVKHISESIMTQWLIAPLAPDIEKNLHRLAALKGVKRLAVMPDIHLAHEVCIGIVVATDTTIYPGAVGGDIGCGMVALAFNSEADLLDNERNAARLISALYQHQHVPANKHRRETVGSCIPAELEQMPLSSSSLEQMKEREGRFQFGTLGRGNHFLELQRDEGNRLWLMIHSGSRGIGRAIYNYHLARSLSDEGLPYLESDISEGQNYLADHYWAIRYAELSRLQMVKKTAELIHDLFSIVADWNTFFQCNHNHVQREFHFEQALWVHRKGALPAHNGTPGMIPGSMGSPSYHVIGRGCEPALCSSSHGAGRQMSRSEARHRITLARLEGEMKGVFYDHRKSYALREEAPSAYRDIEKVMKAQRELTCIVRKLWPILSYKGSA